MLDSRSSKSWFLYAIFISLDFLKRKFLNSFPNDASSPLQFVQGSYAAGD